MATSISELQKGTEISATSQRQGKQTYMWQWQWQPGPQPQQKKEGQTG